MGLAWLAVAPAAAEDWPQWRGPNRDGIAAGETMGRRASWPPTLDVGWTVQVGIGHSSPVVADGKVYVHARRGEQETVSSFELATGRRLWTQSYDAPYTMSSAARAHGKGPKATPVLNAGRLYSLGISGILSCFKASTGELVWRKELSDRFAVTSPLYGVAMSPLVSSGLVVVHLGGHDDGALMALDAGAGTVRWTWSGDGPAYASPVVAELGGVRQVVTQTQTHVVGIDLTGGKLLWQIPFSTPWDQNSVTPVVSGDSVIYSGLDQGTHAVRVGRSEGRWHTTEAWRNADVSMYLSSPILVGDRLFGLSNSRKGRFFCLDVRSGKTLWQSGGRQGDSAALVGAGGVLLLLTTDAELIVAAQDAQVFTPLATYTVAESPTWAHPAVAGGQILVKDRETLTLWHLD